MRNFAYCLFASVIIMYSYSVNAQCSSSELNSGVTMDLEMSFASYITNITREQFSRNIHDSVYTDSVYLDRTHLVYDLIPENFPGSAQVKDRNSTPSSVRYFGIYVDWNRDGDFSDQNEIIKAQGESSPYFTSDMYQSPLPQDGKPCVLRIIYGFDESILDDPSFCTKPMEGELLVIDYSIIYWKSLNDVFEEGSSSECTNSGFETGDFNIGYASIGNRPILVDSNCCLNQAIVKGEENEVLESNGSATNVTHAIVSQGNDEIFENLKRVRNNGGNHSLRIGNLQNNGKASKYSLSYKIKENSEEFFRVSYAGVLGTNVLNESKDSYLKMSVYLGQYLVDQDIIFGNDLNSELINGYQYFDWKSKAYDFRSHGGIDARVEFEIVSDGESLKGAYAYIDIECDVIIRIRPIKQVFYIILDVFRFAR